MGKLQRLFAAGLGSVVMLVGGAVAQTQQSPQPFPSWYQTARPSIEQMDAIDAEPCTDATPREIVYLGSAPRPFRLAGEQPLIEMNATRERALLEARGCGRPNRLLAVDVHTVEGRQPFLMQTIPGRSEIDSGVLRDVMREVFAVRFGVMHPNCRSFVLLDSRMLAGQAYESGQTWREVWTYRACGSNFEAEIAFTFADGGLIFRSQADSAQTQQ